LTAVSGRSRIGAARRRHRSIALGFLQSERAEGKSMNRKTFLVYWPAVTLNAIGLAMSVIGLTVVIYGAWSHNTALMLNACLVCLFGSAVALAGHLWVQSIFNSRW
jgi:hypothetical protein